MSKTFKSCTIFFISSLWLVLMRIIFSVTNLSDNLSSWLFSFLVQVIGMGLIPITMYKLWIKEDIFVGLSIKPKIDGRIYVVAVVIGFLLVYLTKGVSYIWQVTLRILGYTHVNSVGTIYSSPEILIMELLTTALLPAIFEEITDRGLALQMFKEIEDDKITIVLIALLFALAHQNVVQTGYTFVGGLIFAYLALKSGSIIPGMIIHFINNTMSVLASYSSQKNGIYSRFLDLEYTFIGDHLFYALITWIATAVIIFYLLKLINKLSRREKPRESNIPDEEKNYVYASKVDHLARIFTSDLRDEMAAKNSAKWYEYAMLYASVALTLICTLFTFMWGLWR